VIVLLGGITGLRRGEAIGLRSRDIDFQLKQANLTHSVWHNVEADAKTEASQKFVPLPTLVVEELKQWRKTTGHGSDGDFLLPFIAKNGTQPLTPDMTLRPHNRPALKRSELQNRSVSRAFDVAWQPCFGSTVSISKLPRSDCDTRTAESRWISISCYWT
jgi:integrase